MVDAESIIIMLILLLTAVGAVDCLFTLKRIGKEQERLAEFCNPRRKPGKYFDDGLLEDYEQRELLESLDEKEKEVGSLLLVDQRWAAMLKAVKEDNAVRRIPSFTSLRAINLQQSYASHAVWLRVVMPMLLVLGICGTLVGVHEALGMPVEQAPEQQAMMAYVSQALLPGILATFCTIVLMIFRGFYRKAFNEMMRELDNMTLCVFLPSLQIQSHLGVTIEEFCRHIGKLTEFAKACDEVHEKMERGFVSLMKVCDALSGNHALQQLTHAVVRYGGLLSELVCLRQDCAAAQPKRVCMLEGLYRRRSALREEMQSIESMVKEYLPCEDGGMPPVSHPMQVPLEGISRLRGELLPNWARQRELCAAVHQNLTEWLQRASDMWTQVDAVLGGVKTFLEQLSGVAKVTEGAAAALVSMQGSMEGLRLSIPALEEKAGAVSMAVVADQLDGAYESYSASFAGLWEAQRSLMGQCSREATRVWEYQAGLTWMARLRGAVRTRAFYAKMVILRMGKRGLSIVKWLLVVVVGVLLLAAVVYGVYRAVQLDVPVQSQTEDSRFLRRSSQQDDSQQKDGERAGLSPMTPYSTLMGPAALKDYEASEYLPEYSRSENGDEE